MKRFQKLSLAVGGLISGFFQVTVANAESNYVVSVPNENVEVVSNLLNEKMVQYNILNQDDEKTVISVERSKVIDPEIAKTLEEASYASTVCQC